MGLDITAYRKLEATVPAGTAIDDVAAADMDDRFFVRAHHLAWVEATWPGRAEGLTTGLFRFAEAFSFGAGSYGGYNHWRDWLAHIAGFKSADQVWEKKPQGPFVELINFADNEGFIGPVVSAKLAKDFAEHQAKVDALELDEDYQRAYSNWRKAFEMAADGGAIEFH